MEVYGKRSQENGPKTEKDKTERATGLGRITKEEIYNKVGSNWKPWHSRQEGDVRNLTKELLVTCTIHTVKSACTRQKLQVECASVLGGWKKCEVAWPSISLQPPPAPRHELLGPVPFNNLSWREIQQTRNVHSDKSSQQGENAGKVGIQAGLLLLLLLYW